jgi:hypothetical protein
MMCIILPRMLVVWRCCCLVVGLNVAMMIQVSGQEGKALKASEEYRIGVMVKAVAAAIQSPEKSDSMGVIVRFGTDSRYYVMIRGWLKQELSGAQSLFDVARDPQQKAKFELKVSFLKKAIRRIDLE